jgi:hypothetical protein
LRGVSSVTRVPNPALPGHTTTIFHRGEWPNNWLSEQREVASGREIEWQAQWQEAEDWLQKHGFGERVDRVRLDALLNADFNGAEPNSDKTEGDKTKSDAEMTQDAIWALDEIMTSDRKARGYLRSHSKHVTAANGLLKRKYPGNHLRKKEVESLAWDQKYRACRRAPGNPHSQG